MTATRTRSSRQAANGRTVAGPRGGGRETRSASELSAETFQAAFEAIVANVEKVVKGKSDVIRLALVAALCEGHVLFEDVPGTGKSMLARSLSVSLGASTARVQCTPDMLPADITGSSVFDQAGGRFDFHPGPVFTNVLLVDEVNRATPKTQSALLEAMAERKVSSDGVTRELPRPFLVMATQNPVELAGTFPLPEAQLDRFLFKLTMGYADREAEHEIIFDNQRQLSVEALTPVADLDLVSRMIDYVVTVDIEPDVSYYLVDLVRASREDPALAIGGSSRASIALLRASKALAASDGRTDVYPDDVRAVLPPILTHRLILNPDALLRGEDEKAVIDRIISNVRPPNQRR